MNTLKKTTGFMLAAICGTAILSSTAEACARFSFQPGAWNVKFTNVCNHSIVVTWYCTTSCQTGCATSPIRPGGFDNGYCHNGRISVRWQRFPR